MSSLFEPTPQPNRRQFTVLALAGALVALAGCSPPSPFQGIDISGASYAQDFDLIDQHGQRRTLADFRGQVVVVFFGFTQCPDVCPTTMGEMAHARALLGEQGDRFQGIFISLDPERDTPEILAAYVASFDPSFLAFSPSADRLPELARSFRVHYKKVPGPTPTSYTIDHSAGSYIYDPQGRLRVFHRHGSGGPALASDVKYLLAE